MDIIKFENWNHPMYMAFGSIVNGLKSKMWVERYDNVGEFTLVGDADSGLRDLLPLGSFITHTDTEEIMVVENHEINSSKDKESEIKISGRSYVSIFDRRVPGANRTYPLSNGVSDLSYDPDQDQDQIVKFMQQRFMPGFLTYAEDEILGVEIYTTITGGPAAPERFVKVGSDGLAETWKMLNAAGYSMRARRPGPYAWTGPWNFWLTDNYVGIEVFKGEDKSDSVIISYDAGEIESADYFWSLKSKKTLAVVTGKWCGVRAGTGEQRHNRRMVHIDASGMDNLYNVAPTGAALTAIHNGMTQKGLDALAQMKETNIVNVSVSREGIRAKFREDYFVGDIITVQGEFNTTAPFRVTEYVEIEDENGASGYPTLSAV